ncbi:hypothetical protein [Paenibacillus sp. Y412MC10]|uniref:hypothetical protein n=1 Tax=Geobacillus sp. (strain Y412MC10) TaxID=481743 RepID=UPI0011AB7678|nr:hypothetical protein [Paenibacillus sp. Y412MC10]
MRSGKYAVYRGKEYALGKTGRKWAYLRCTDPRSVIDGFVPNKFELGTYCKRVNKTDLDDTFLVQTFLIYEGSLFMARRHTGNLYVIGTSNKKLASQLGFTFISKHNYEKWVSEADCQEIFEEKIPYSS